MDESGWRGGKDEDLSKEGRTSTVTLLRLHPNYRTHLRPRPLLLVRLRTSGVPDSHGVTGGVYKARERIHRGMLIRDY